MQEFDFQKATNRKGTYSVQWDYIERIFGYPDLLPFSIADMDFETAPVVKEALLKRVRHGVFGYSVWDNDDFKSAIALWYKNQFATDINKEALVYSPSIVYSVSALIEKYSQKGGSVILQTPAYNCFFDTISGLGRKLINNPLIYDSDGQAHIDFGLLSKQAKEADIILLCSPHNPTGRVWNKDELSQIMEIAIKNDIAIISDDAHQDIVYAPNRFTPLAEIWGDYPKAAILTSITKGFNTASICGSYILFNAQKDKQDFLKELQVRGFSTPVLFTTALVAAYTQGQAWLKALVETLKNNMIYIDDFLKKNLPQIKMAIPQGTYLAWLNTQGLNLSSKEIQERLIKKGKLAISDGRIFHQDTPYLRLNAGCPLSKIEDGMERLLKSFS